MAAKSLDFILKVQGSERLTSALKAVRDMFAKVAEAEDGATLSARDLNAAYTELKNAYMEVAGAGGKAVAATKQDSEAKKLAVAFSKEYADSLGVETEQLQAQTVAATENAKAFLAARDAAEAQRLSMGKSFNTVSSISRAGNPAFMKIAGWAGIDAVGLAYESVKKFMTFNSKLTQSVTQAGVPLRNMNQISAGILDISRQTGQSANDLADAFYRVASATAGSKASVKDMLTYTKAIAQFNVLGNIPQGVQSENSARVVMAAVNAQLRGTQGTGKVAVDKIIASLNAIIGSGDIRASDLLAGFGRGYLAVGKANNLSMADMGAAIDTLTQLGTGGAAAGTMAQRAIQMMFSPTTQGAKGLAMVGLKYDSLRKAEATGGLPAALKMLSDHLKKFDVFNYPKYKGASGRQGAINQLEEWFQGQLPQSFIDKWSKGMASKGGLSEADQRQIMTMMLSKMYGGSRSSATMMNLLFDLPRLTANYQNIQAHSTQAYLKKREEIANKSPAVQFRKVVSNINADLIQLGKTLTPLVVKLAKGFEVVINAIIKFKPILYTLLTAVAGLATAYVGIKAAQLAKGMFSMFGGIQRGAEGASLWMQGYRGDARRAAMSAGDSGSVSRRAWAARNGGRAAADAEIRQAMEVLGMNEKALVSNTEALTASTEASSIRAKGGLGAVNTGAVPSRIRGAEGVASEGVAVAEEGGSMLGRMAGGLGSALSFLSGPAGMAAMVALPFALPLLSKGLSWLFGGGSNITAGQTYSGLGVVSYNQQHKKLVSQMNNAGKNLGTGKASDVLGYLGYLGKSTNLNTKFGKDNETASFLKGFNNYNSNNKNSKKYVDPNDQVGLAMRAIEAKTAKAQKKKLLDFIKKNPEIAAFLAKDPRTALQYKELMGTTSADIASKNKKIQNLAIKNALVGTQDDVKKYFKAMNNKKLAGGPQMRYLTGVLGAEELKRKLKEEETMLKTKGLTTGQQVQLGDGIRKLKNEIVDMKIKAVGIAQKNKLDPTSIKALAIEIANQNKAVYTSLGMGKDGFVSAMTALIPAIAQGIKTGNANHNSNQTPGTIASK